MRSGRMKIRIREVIFIEDNMMGDENFLSNEIHTYMDAMINKRSKVDTGGGARREFVWHS